MKNQPDPSGHNAGSDHPRQGPQWQAYQPGGYPPGYPPAQPPGYPPDYPTYPASAAAGAAQDDPTAVVGARVGQYIVDNLLVAVPLIVLWALVGGGLASLAASAASASPDPDAVGNAIGGLFIAVIWLAALVSAAAGWAVMAWWPARHDGQTPAMRWFNLRIITEDGRQPTLGALTVRWLLLIVDGLFGGLVGLIVMLNSPRHQRLGDSVAKTLVVRTR